MKHLIVALAALGFLACTHEVVKPKSQWQVKTSTDSEKKIWVTRADGSRQCAKAKTPKPEQVAAQVQKAGILIFQSQAGTDGLMHAQECGAPTGRTIDLQISKIDLRKVLSLGFVTKENAPPDEPQSN